MGRSALAGARPDALFLSLKAAQARLLSSQMDAAGLIGVPRVATSLILSGANLRMDVELDGIEYPELPWLLGLRGGLPDAEALGRTLPTAQGGGARLFAFGLDAWKLAAYADMLARDPAAQLRGATGELHTFLVPARVRCDSLEVVAAGAIVPETRRPLTILAAAGDAASTMLLCQSSVSARGRGISVSISTGMRPTLRAW